jgi:hydrogenase nickel incorporation protein HypB
MPTPLAPSAQKATRTVELRLSLLESNDRQAVANRRRFKELGMVALNLVSSPGSGKTTLLERTLAEFGAATRCAAVVGDLATDNDARRLGRTVVHPWRQINTTRHPRATSTPGMVDKHLAGWDGVTGGLDASLAGARIPLHRERGQPGVPVLAIDLGEQIRVVAPAQRRRGRGQAAQVPHRSSTPPMSSC